MMALNLPSYGALNQSYFVSEQRSSRAINQRSRVNQSQISGAFFLRTLNRQRDRSSNSLQVHRAWRSVRHQELGARQRRAWTRSSAPVEEQEKVLNEPQHEADAISLAAVEVLNFPKITAEAEPATVRHEPQKSGGGGGLQWILGPLALLITGALPALWLPSPSLFHGSDIAGLLALNGLDATFNMGATAFLLMAHSSARNKNGNPNLFKATIPLGYKVWSFLVNLVGLVAPIALVVACLRGAVQLQPSLESLPAAALLGPYILLLVVQWLAETMVWQWRSPVWPVLPLVYQAYRVLQLTRGVELGAALDAPAWLVEAVKGLVAWWVFVLGMQIMWVSWLVGNIEAQAGSSSST